MDNCSECKYIGELPSSKYPWKITIINNKIIIANQEHEPYIITDDGILKKLELDK